MAPLSTLRARPAPTLPAGRALAACLALAACSVGARGGGAGGAGGGGGAGGAPACPDDVAPLFTLRVQGPGGALPLDLALAVTWSAGDEPVVLIADPGTFGDADSNVICALLDAGGGPSGGAGGEGEGGASPADAELVCELWTSGPTQVVLLADGFVPIDETLVPEVVEGCERPVPSEAILALEVEAPTEE